MTERRRAIRRLWPFTLFIALSLILLSYLQGSTPSQIEWPAIATQPQPSWQPPPDTAEPVVPPMQQYSLVWTTPLFNVQRQADSTNQVQPPVEAVPPLDGVIVTGIVVAGTVKIAMFKDSSGKTFSVNEGKTLANGWTLARITERHIELSYGQTQKTLELSVPRLPMTLP